MDIRGTKTYGISGFTVLELMVAVAVTALLAGILLKVSTQVLETQRLATGDLETNQVAQFVLDRIQEDLQCAVYRNDGNTWMAISILDNEENSGQWRGADEGRDDIGKPIEESLRLIGSHWPEEESLDEEELDHLGQGPFEKSRFGVAGAWLRFFTQAPELDQNATNTGGARAISYQIIRHGLTASSTSSVRYQLFRSDVSARNTFEAGYDLHPDAIGYNENAEKSSLDPINPESPRVASTIINPIIPLGSDYSATSFSLAANIIDFGLRAYVLERNSFGTGNLVQIFPPIENKGQWQGSEELLSTSYQGYKKKKFPFHAFPDVIDLFVRVLSNEGARLIESLESNQNQNSQDWWEIAEEHSKVFFRRVKIYGQGL